MKIKIVGFLVCMLLITATVIPATGNLKEKSVLENNIKSDSRSVEISSDRTNLDWILKAQQTSDNNYILIGLTETYGAGSRDAWLIKTDSDGNELWNKTWGRSQCDGVQSGQETSDGGYVLAGWGRWPSSWDTDFWLIKTDANGNEQWNKRYGSTSDDTGYFVQQTSDNGYIFTGITKSYGSGDWDVWLVKTDGLGNEQWNNSFGGMLTDGGFVVRQTNDGGYIITGWVDSFGSGAHDVWLIKTDSNGNELWNKTFGGVDKDAGHDVQQTSDGGYIIIGYTNSYGDHDRDFWLIKTDGNGDMTWNKTFEGADCLSGIGFMGHSGGMSVRQITDGYIMVGVTDASYGEGLLSVLMIETDNFGNENWNKTFGGSHYDEGYWINETSDGGYIISGGTMSYGTSTVDGWVIKTDSNGNKQWDKIFPPNRPPYTPSDPNPENGETDVNIDVELSWEGGDPDGDPVKYDIYFGTESPPPKVKSNQSGKTYVPGILDFNTEYFWQIVAWDTPGDLSASSPIWSFTTEENLPPNTPNNPNPSDGATDVPIKKILRWSGGDPNSGDTVTYDVYFGKSSPPPMVEEDISDTSYDPDTMDLDTTYFWQIVAEDSQGESASGQIWNFTTELEPNEPPTEPDIDGPNQGSPGEELCWEFHSDDPDGNQIKYNIDWGDGNSSETGFNAPCTPVEVCYTYEEDGEYVITATAEDEKGLMSDESTFSVKVTTPRSRPVYNSLLLWLFERFSLLERLLILIKVI